MEHLEGKCTNCGSIIRILKDKETNCIFCYAKNNYNDSLAALNNPATVFPNKQIAEPSEQEKKEAIAVYQGLVHNQFSHKRKTTSNQPALKKQKNTEKGISPVERVLQMQSEVFNPKANTKILYTSVAIFLLILTLFIAVSIPLTLNRNERRSKIIASFKENTQEKGNLVELDKNEYFHFLSSFSEHQFSLLVKNKLDLSEVKFLFKAYEKAILSVNNEPVTQISDLKMKIINKDTSYQIAYDKMGNMQITELKK